MQTVAASVILDDLYRLMAWDTDQLEDRQKENARMAMSLALQEIWDAWWWEELMTVAQQGLRDTYSDVSVVAGDEVYYPPTRKYYQALADHGPGYPPAVDEYNSGDFTPNPSWREVELNPQADDYDTAELAAGNYEAGDLVRYPDDDLFYQYLGSFTVTGAGIADVNTTYVRVGLANQVNGGRPQYVRANGSFGSILWGTIGPLTDIWGIYSDSHGGLAYYSTDDVDTPDLVTTWQSYNGAALPGPTSWDGVALPGNPSFWGVFNPFRATLEINRDVRMVSRLNPLQTNNPGEYDFIKTADGIELTAIPTGKPWIWARRVTPVLTGDDFDAAATYDATAANELVYDS